MSSYHFSKIVDMTFDEAVASIKQALAKHNFRVLTEINMENNFKNALKLHAIHSSLIKHFRQKIR